jgi:hypothetical protein
MAAARSLGWWATKMHGSQYMVSGLPDVLCIKDGAAAWLEVKRPGGKVSKVQEVRIEELRSCGCPVAVVKSASEAREFLSGIG